MSSRRPSRLGDVVIAATLLFTAAACGGPGDPPAAGSATGEARPSLVADGGVVAPRAMGSLPPAIVDQLSELAGYPLALGVPGVVTLIEVEGVGRWVSAAGVSGLEDGAPPVQADSVFGIGSITKTFTPTAVLRLIAEPTPGLTLETTLSSFDTVPTVPNDDEITVAQLLQHTSGIADYAGNPEFYCLVLPSSSCTTPPDVTYDFAPQELVGIASTMPPFGAPGTGWHYSNTNYVILGMIIEELTGQPAEQVITELVIEPLDLDDTTFPASPDEAAELLTTRPSLILTEGTTVLERVDYGAFNPSAYWTAGAIVSTAEDLAIWAHALAQGALLPLDLQLQRLRTVPIGDLPPLPGFPGQPLPSGYGLGIARFGDYLGHNGAVPGYQSIAVYDPYRKSTIVMLLNAYVYEEAAGVPTSIDDAIPTQLLPSFSAVLAEGLLPPVR